VARKMSIGMGVAALLCIGLSQNSQASVVSIGLFDTGVDSSGVALTGGDGVTDPHYTVLNSTIGATVGANAVTYLNPAYVPDSAGSRWISNSSDGNPGNGVVTFTTSFDLTGFNPATATITGRWGVDNIGEIFLNGHDTSIGLPYGYPAFEALHPFGITGGFLAGINTLSFEVTDTGPPLALRVDELSANITATPLPAALPLFVTGLGVMGLLARRRKQKKLEA